VDLIEVARFPHQLRQLRNIRRDPSRPKAVSVMAITALVSVIPPCLQIDLYYPRSRSRGAAMLKVLVVGLFTLVLVGSADAQSTCPNRGRSFIALKGNAE
jgi:hypothetical protein